MLLWQLKKVVNCSFFRQSFPIYFSVVHFRSPVMVCHGIKRMFSRLLPWHPIWNFANLGMWICRLVFFLCLPFAEAVQCGRSVVFDKLFSISLVFLLAQRCCGGGKWR